jgi:ABC-type sugar transport system substrate-binding protein
MCAADNKKDDDYYNSCDSNTILDIMDDDPNTCVIDRSVIGPIKVIVHGTKKDPFWQQVYAGMKQTADDMDIDLEMILYDNDNDENNAMVKDIQKYVDYANSAGSGDYDDNSRRMNTEVVVPLPAAMIVSLPGDSRIEDELKKLQAGASNIPIFGINAIHVHDNDSPSFLVGTVSMNETHAGIVAGHQIRDILMEKENKNTDDGSAGITGIYINHRSDVHALNERFDALATATKDVVESWEMVRLEKGTDEEDLVAMFEGCHDTVVQLAGTGDGNLVDAVLAALVANGCNIKDDHIVGTFDVSDPLVYDAMADGSIKFAVSQQPYLQGSNAVLMAALYATTGQTLSSKGTNLQTGPVLITPENNNFPAKQQQVCEAEGFPVCSAAKVIAGGNSNSNSNNDSDSDSACPCTDRSEISITVITHDESSDFWDTVFSGISQAATDFGVSIQKNQFKKATPTSSMHSKRLRAGHQGTQRASRLKHTFDINEACQSPKSKTNGLIVSLPDASMVDSLAGCVSRGIPYLAINAMAGLGGGGGVDGTTQGDDDDETGPLLQYVGQKDYESGREAGRRLIQAGVNRGWCLVHSNFDTIHERCRGMENAFSEAGSSETEFMGSINVPSNNDIPLYKKTVEGTIGQVVESDADDWSGIGVLSTGRIQIPALLSLVEDHPEMLAGTFDLDSTLYGKDGSTLPDQIVFGIDQNAYMEGYLSVATMVWRISTSETSTTAILETGPNFVVQSDLSSETNNDSPFALQAHRQQECRNKNIKFCRSNNEKKNEVVSLPPDNDILEKEKPYKEERPLALTGKCKSLGRKCGACEGDCDDDTDCGDGLVCFVRDSKTKGQAESVPGCSTNPIEWTSKDFCVDANLYQCKDQDNIEIRVGTFSISRTCEYVKEDLVRCKEYGRYCRETCGYCRTEPHDGKETDY